MGRPDFEDLEVYRLAERFANEIWFIVKQWDNFAKDTIGKQIVRAADSVCANIRRGEVDTISKTIDVLSRLLEGLYTKQ
jgi:four helix bundle protein